MSPVCDLATNYHMSFKPTISRYMQTASQPAHTAMYATMQDEIADTQEEIAADPNSPEVEVVIDEGLAAFFDELTAEENAAQIDENETQPASDQEAASHAAPVGEVSYSTLLAAGLDKSDDDDDCPATLVVVEDEAMYEAGLTDGGEDSLTADPYSASSLAADTAPKTFVRLSCVPIVAPKCQGQWQPLGRYGQ
jgi:DNA-binding ferritin-like protein (Dps family)